MRRLVVYVVIASVGAVTLPALADHKPHRFCGENGVCAYTRKDDGVQKLKITTQEHLFDTYKVCVKAPDDTRQCEKFSIEADGDMYKDVVRWGKHFPNKGDGAYTARWKSGGENLTTKLGFHID